MANIDDDIAHCLQVLSDYQLGITAGYSPKLALATPDNARSFLLALLVEVAELANVMEIKPWYKYQQGPRTDEERAQIANEFADVLAFLGCLLGVLEQWGIYFNMLASAYTQKSRLNQLRASARGVWLEKPAKEGA